MTCNAACTYFNPLPGNVKARGASVYGSYGAAALLSGHKADVFRLDRTGEGSCSEEKQCGEGFERRHGDDIVKTKYKEDEMTVAW